MAVPTALRPSLRTPPSRSAPRQALAEAIEAARAANARHTALATALAAAERAVITASHAIDAAETGIIEAREAAAQHLVAVAAGNAGDAPRTVRQARDKLQDAQDQLDAARSARDELRRQDAAEARDPEAAATRLREAVAAVIRAEWQGRADALVHDVTESYADLIEKAALVRMLADAGLFPNARDHRGELVGSIEAMCRLAISNFMAGDPPARARGDAQFRGMVDSLLANADAPLP